MLRRNNENHQKQYLKTSEATKRYQKYHKVSVNKKTNWKLLKNIENGDQKILKIIKIYRKSSKNFKISENI